jgi:hypothetical protein
MKTFAHSLLKPTMCLQAQTWSRGFATVNSIPGSQGSREDWYN